MEVCVTTDSTLGNTLWKLQNFTLTKKKFRENNIHYKLVLSLSISRNFCLKMVRVNKRNCHWKYFVKMNYSQWRRNLPTIGEAQFSVKTICKKLLVISNLEALQIFSVTAASTIESLPSKFFSSNQFRVKHFSRKATLTNFLRQNRGSKIP